MSDQLILDDDALASAASHFNGAAQEMTRDNMSAPIGELRGLTGLESRVSEFLAGIVAAKTALGEAAHSGGVAMAGWMTDSSEVDTALSHALSSATQVRVHG